MGGGGLGAGSGGGGGMRAGPGDAPTGGPSPRGSGGGSGGITAPAGTAITKTGLATVTTPSGKKFQVDARYAENFKGFLSDYEKAGGVLGPDTGSLGFRPRNASGHPIGAAIDVNQVGYGVRSRRGTTLPADVEDTIAAKWGMVSGHQWRKPDTGHFGIRSFEAARQALIKNGVAPDKATEIAAASSAERSSPGSWYSQHHGKFNWSDRGDRPGSNALGVPDSQQGIALPSKRTLGKYFDVTAPNGQTYRLQQTDIGPAAKTDRTIDISAAAAEQMGYSPRNFPTDRGLFKYRPASDDRSALGGEMTHRVEGTGSIDVNVSAPPGTAVKSKFGGLFKKHAVNRQTQMAPAQSGPETGAVPE